MTELVTHSRLQSFKVCRRQHWYAYEHRVRRTIDGRALRMGSAFHAGLEWLARADLDQACAAVWDEYRSSPNSFDQREWEIECETVVRSLCCYAWYWADSKLEHIEVERQFELPLLNPETGRPTPNFNLAGKIDGIVRLEDGRLAVLEHKLLSEELDSDAGLWRRLRIDQQITLYIYAARRLGFECDCVLYDVTRKPTIRPEVIPHLDADGLKIVLDANGERVMTKQGKPRQTGSQEQGFVLQSRDMTPEEWGDKLAADMTERPQFYFARREVPRLDDDIRQFEQELWDMQLTLREAQLKNRWYRTATKDSCSWCAVFDLCTQNFDPASGTLPESFVIVPSVHQELETTHVVSPSKSLAPGSTAAACATA